MPKPIPNWIQFIPGYMQNRAVTNLGLPLLAHEFYERYDQTGLARVEFDEWYSDWDAQAEWVRRLSFGCVAPKLLVIAYSWGVGFGALRFCRALRDRGLEVEHLITSDGVWHLGGPLCHKFKLSQVMAFYPFFPCFDKALRRMKLHVPDNVKGIDWYIQNNARCCERLRGHEMVWQDSGETCPNRHPVRYRIHNAMDECPEFWARCIEVADALFVNKEPVA